MTIRHETENFLIWPWKIYKFGIMIFYSRRRETKGKFCFHFNLSGPWWFWMMFELLEPFYSFPVNGTGGIFSSWANFCIWKILIEISTGMEIYSQGACPFWKNFQCLLWDKITLEFSFHCYLKILNCSFYCHCWASLFEKRTVASSLLILAVLTKHSKSAALCL